MLTWGNKLLDSLHRWLGQTVFMLIYLSSMLILLFLGGLTILPRRFEPSSCAAYLKTHSTRPNLPLSAPPPPVWLSYYTIGVRCTGATKVLYYANNENRGQRVAQNYNIMTFRKMTSFKYGLQSENNNHSKLHLGYQITS